MAGAEAQRHVYFMDTRGELLENTINSLNKSGVKIEPWVFADASFRDVVHEALYSTKTRPFDLIFICAGIFDFIKKDSTTGDCYFPRDTCEQLIPAMRNMVQKADDRLLKERPATKIIYCPIMGVDLEVVLKKKAVQEQLILNEGIWAINLKFYELNNASGLYCPNLVLPVHRIINKKRKNYYQHLAEDGLRLTEELRNRWASEMLKATDPKKPYCKLLCASKPKIDSKN